MLIYQFMARIHIKTVFHRDQLNPFRTRDICQSVKARDMGLMCAHQHAWCVCVCVCVSRGFNALCATILAESRSPFKAGEITIIT